MSTFPFRGADLPRLATALLLAGAAALVLGRGVMHAVDTHDEITIGMDIWVGFAPLHLAAELGCYQQEGLEVALVTLKGAPEMRAALASDRVQGVTTSLDTALRKRAIGTPARVALGLDRSAGADGLVAREPITSIDQLRGRQVAAQAATPSEFLLLYLLHDAGVPLDAVERVEMDSADAGAAFVAGSIDAAVTWEPWLGQAAASDGAIMLATTAEHPHAILDVLMLHDRLLDEHPDQVEALQRCWFAAVEHMSNHPEADAALLAPHYGVEPVVFTDMISGLEYLDRPANQALFSDPTSSPAGDMVDAANAIFLESGIIDEAVPASALIHTLAAVP